MGDIEPSSNLVGIDHCTYCGKREGAKYHNNQCFIVPPTVFGQKTKRAKTSYTCLNRMDIAEERIRRTVTYNKNISSRNNFFEIFNENDTRDHSYIT